MLMVAGYGDHTFAGQGAKTAALCCTEFCRPVRCDAPRCEASTILRLPSQEAHNRLSKFGECYRYKTFQQPAGCMGKGV